MIIGWFLFNRKLLLALWFRKDWAEIKTRDVLFCAILMLIDGQNEIKWKILRIYELWAKFDGIMAKGMAT